MTRAGLYHPSIYMPLHLASNVIFGTGAQVKRHVDAWVIEASPSHHGFWILFI